MSSTRPAAHRLEPSDDGRRPGWRPSRLGVVALGLFLLCGAIGTALASFAGAAPSSTLSWTWSMPDRFGLDADHDGVIDYATPAGYAAYVAPEDWNVDVDACASPAVKDRGATTRVTWTVTGAALPQAQVTVATCSTHLSVPALGGYHVVASLTDESAVQMADDITLKDTFIVSIGDSVASGEGNPDKVTRKDTPLPLYQATWEDYRCDRSALAGPAQAALRLEKRDPHSSVTFVHLACSGATIADGVLGPYEGQNPPPGVAKIPPQFDRVKTLSGVRRIDDLTVSIGANDMGFGTIVKSCLYEVGCDQPGATGRKTFDEGWPKLAGKYAPLEAGIAALGTARIGHVVQTEYYDVSTADGSTAAAPKYCTGTSAQENTGDTAPGTTAPVDGFSPAEYTWARETVGVKLNQLVADHVAHANTTFPSGPQWTLVNGIADAFNGHGYCATDRYVRQLFESLSYQGAIDGAFHPNTEGHLRVYGAKIEQAIAGFDGWNGTQPLPFANDDRVALATNGVSTFLGTLDESGAFDRAADDIPFGARAGFKVLYDQLFQGIAQLQQGIPLSVPATTTWTAWENKLNDLDGDGDPTSDVHLPTLPGVKVDLQVTTSPKLVADHYDVDVALNVTAAGDTQFAWLINQLDLADSGANLRVGATASFTVGTTMKLSLLDSLVKFKVGPVAAVDLSMGGAFGTGNALAFQSGVLAANATGTVNADIGEALSWNASQDTNHDGWITLSELTSTPFSLGCTSTGVQANLSVSASLTGLTGKLGSISLVDPTLCDGLSAPQVQLADLSQFQNVTIGDILNGVAQVVRSLQTAQAAGDVDLPFLRQKLSAVTDVTSKLTQFFVDLGLTSRDQPLATIDVEKAGAAGITTLQGLAGKLSCAVFATSQATCTDTQRGQIGVTYDADHQRVTFTVAYHGAPGAKAASVDLGSALDGLGVAGLTGTASATVTPTFDVTFGFGFSLTPDTDLAHRFFLTNGPSGNVISLDAPVKADLSLAGSLALADLTLADANASGTVDLLTAPNPAKPMVGVALVDPTPSDGVVTLQDLITPQSGKLPISVAFNAAVPATTLTARLQVLGQNLASGSVTLAWPDVSDADGLKVTADANFARAALPFAYDPSNPQALVGQVIGAVRTALTSVRGAIAKGGTATTTPLPLVGKSIADLDPVLGKLQTSLDTLVATTDTFTLATLQAKVNGALVGALGAPSGSSLVTFSYDATGTDGRPALVVKLGLGACTSDRVAKLPAGTCTVTVSAFTGPIALSLGNSSLGGLAGATTDGGVVAGFDARATLTFGVLLPRFVLNAGGVPTVDPTAKTPSFFLQDDSSFEVGVGATVNATLKANLGPIRAGLGSAAKPATAKLAAHLLVKDPQATGTTRYVIGTPAFGAYLGRLVPSLAMLNLQETRTGLATDCAPLQGATVNPQACATLPVFVLDGNGNPSTPLGTIKVTLPKLLEPSGWDVNTTEVEAALNDQALQFGLVVDGVDSLAAQLQHGLENLPPGTKIPFIGSDVTAGVDVVKTFRDGTLGKLKDLATAVQGKTTIAGVRAAAQQPLSEIANLQQDSGGVKLLPTMQFLCGTGPSPTLCPDESKPITTVRAVQFGVKIFIGADDTIPFDIGFPGLSLTGGDNVKYRAGLTLNLAFGIDRQLGFYVPTKDNANSMELGLEVRLPHADGPDFTGTIAFVPIQVEDNWPTNPDNKTNASDASASIKVVLTSTRADGRVGLNDLSSLSITPTVDAHAHIDLTIKTVKPEGAPSGIPSISTDLRSEAGVTWEPGHDPVTQASLAFNNVTLDAGSLVSDFITPVIGKIHEYTQPLEKPIAELQKTIPGTDIGTNQGTTWLQLMRAVAGNGTAIQVVDRIIQLTDLVATLDNPSAVPGTISIGSFQVAGTAVTAPVPPSAAGTVIGSPTATTNPLSQLQFQGDADGTKSGALAAQTTKGGLDIPILSKPTSLFSLLLGQDVPLVTFDAGTLSVAPSLQVSFPVGPALVYVGGLFKVTGHFAAGFDTYGIRQALMHKDDGPAAIGYGLLQGFYLDDNDASGKDVPEISLRAELTVGASIGIPGFSFAIEGGIGGQFDFNLYTKPEWKGKVRIQNIVDQLNENPNPLCFFDIGAKVDIFLRLKVQSPVGNATFDIADATIWKQRNLNASCHGGEGPGSPATFSKGVVTLKGTDQFDDFVVTLDKPDAAGRRVVTVDNGFDDPIRFAGVTKVVGDLGRGDDSLQVLVDDDAIGTVPITVCGGAGSDSLNAATVGPATFYGDGGPDCATVATPDAGNDRLTGSLGNDTLSGGPGDDTLVGNDGQDTLKGEDGSDTLKGDGGVDQLDGGTGDDVLVGGDGNDNVAGGDGADTVDYSDRSAAVTVTLPGRGGSGNEADTISSVENATGGLGADTIKVATGLPTIVSGGYGPDTFRTGTSPALVLGGLGNDSAIDEPGAQLFYGGWDTDTFSYAAATAPVNVTVDGVADDGVVGAANPDNIAETEIVNGGTAGDHLVAGSQAVTFNGNGGDDLLEGGAGGDTLNGGDGKDVLRGGQGVNQLSGGKGADRLVGGTDADTFDGGPDEDTVDYSERTDPLRITLDGVRNDGRQAAWPNAENDLVGDTVEVVIGGSNDDEIYGSSRPEKLYGGPGTDRVQGGADGALGVDGGADLLVAGPGGGRLCDIAPCNIGNTGDTSKDTMIGGDGADIIYGGGGDDTVDGGAGRDVIGTGAGADTVRGGPDHDDIWTFGGGDTVDGGTGGDSVDAGDGDDTVVGGGSSTGNPGNEILVGGRGHDTVTASAEGSTAYGGTGNTHLTGQPAQDGLSDTVIGGPGNDVLEGGTGNDTITTGDGVNQVNGMAGDDTITGGSGVDTIDGDSNGDTSADCTDVVGASCNDTIDGAGGDDRIAGGVGRDVIHGGDGRDGLAGGTGDDLLFGDGGDDVLVGGAGSDVMDGGNGSDQLVGWSSNQNQASPAGDIDTVTYAGRTVPVSITEDNRFQGSKTLDKSPVWGQGDRIDFRTVQKIVGGSRDDVLTLAGPRDRPVTVDGGPGSDTITVLQTVGQNSTLIGGKGNDTFVQPAVGDSASSHWSPVYGDDIAGGDGSDTVDYRSRPAGTVFVTKNGTADDGATGEFDNVRSDVEVVKGSVSSGPAPLPKLSIAPVAVSESAGGAVLTVTLSAISARDTTVNWSTVAGTATAGTDFVAASGTVTIAAGQQTATITVQVLADGVQEGKEKFTVALAAPVNAKIATPSAVVTISD
ncbi:Calx-beta domain-containing protein [Jatrophihabitans sp. YIM 134969]